MSATAPVPTLHPDAADHLWELRSVEFEDAFTVRRYECVCGAARFE